MDPTAKGKQLYFTIDTGFLAQNVTNLRLTDIDLVEKTEIVIDTQ